MLNKGALEAQLPLDTYVSDRNNGHNALLHLLFIYLQLKTQKSQTAAILTTYKKTCTVFTKWLHQHSRLK